MRGSWLQKPGTEHEHYDLFGARIARAEKLGAKVLDRRGIVDVWRAKRLALTDARKNAEVPRG